MRVLVLGATGVLGHQCCEVCKERKHKIVGISFYKNVQNARKIKCEYKFSSLYLQDSNIHSFEQLIEKSHPDIIINAISDNTVAMHALKICVQKNIDVILANKEVLILKNAIYEYWTPGWSKQKGSAIIPLDSEHSALLQILSQNFHNYGGIENVKSYGICASGGPFYGKTIQQLKTVKWDDVLAHPVWKMGKYITINSSTMFNKFTEMWEAFYIMKGRIPNVFLDTTSNIHAFVRYKNDDCFIYRHHPTMKSHILDCLNYFSKKMIVWFNKILFNLSF